MDGIVPVHKTKYPSHTAAALELIDNPGMDENRLFVLEVKGGIRMRTVRGLIKAYSGWAAMYLRKGQEMPANGI